MIRKVWVMSRTLYVPNSALPVFVNKVLNLDPYFALYSILFDPK